MAGEWRTRLADGLAATLLVAVPLACAPGLWDPFTTAKWYVLHAAAIAAAGLFAAGGAPVPGFVRRHATLFFLLTALSLASALRTGFPRGAAPLLDRFAVVVVVLLLYAHLRRRRSDLGAICGAVALAVLATDAGVLAQHAGADPLRALGAGDGRSAFFGNVNMAAQFLALATPCLLWGAVRARRRWQRIAFEALLAATLASIALLGSRSAALAAGLVLVAWIARRAAPPTAIAAALAGAVLVAWILLRPGGGGASAFSPETLANKSAATAIRLGLWRGTARMIADHPLGVGAGNFPDQFVPYQLGALRPDEGLLYRWPHDEWLRVAAEDGLPFAVLALAAAVLLLREALRQLRRRGRPPEDGAFLVSLVAALAVESTFQFPFAMAPAVLGAAVLAAFALGLAEAGEARVEAAPAGRSPLLAAGWGLAAVAASCVLVRIAGADYLLARRPGDRAALETACALDPRRSDACVLAAWRELSDGDRARGRQTLERLLAGSPWYHPALKLRAQDALAAGDRQEGCRSLALYDALFAGSSSVHGTLSAQCRLTATTDAVLVPGAAATGRDGS